MSHAILRDETLRRLQEQAATQPEQVRQSLQKLIADLQTADPEEAQSFRQDPRVLHLLSLFPTS